MAEKILFTQEGYDELVAKLEYLKTERRAEVTEQIAVARSFGDLSENAEYDAAKDAQRALEEEIMKLENQLQNASIVGVDDEQGEGITLGYTVKIKNSATKETMTYKIVGITEADPLEGRISNESPVGKALMGHKKGDKVEVVIESKDASEGQILKFQIMEVSK